MITIDALPICNRRWLEEVETLLGSDPPLHREAWHRIKGWYKAAVDCDPPPAQVTLKRITAERVDFYSHIPPPDTNIPVSVQPIPVEDLVTTEDEIEWAVKRLRNHSSGGPSGMRAQHLKRWLETARKAEKDATTTMEREGTEENRGTTVVQPAMEPTEADNCAMVVDLV